jgi:hypothetical protein
LSIAKTTAAPCLQFSPTGQLHRLVTTPDERTVTTVTYWRDLEPVTVACSIAVLPASPPARIDPTRPLRA